MIFLEVKKRNVPSENARTIISEGFIPAELYGHQVKNVHIKVNAGDFSDILSTAGESSLVAIKVDGKEYPVLIHSIQRSPLGDIQHIDFYVVKMGEKITAEIPIEFIGEAPAVKEKNGILITSFDSIEVETLPSLLPHKVDVDLSLLNEIGDSIHIKDITFPKDVKPILDEDSVIVSISEPTKQEEVVEEEVEEGEETENTKDVADDESKNKGDDNNSKESNG